MKKVRKESNSTELKWTAEANFNISGSPDILWALHSLFSTGEAKLMEVKLAAANSAEHQQ